MTEGSKLGRIPWMEILKGNHSEVLGCSSGDSWQGGWNIGLPIPGQWLITNHKKKKKNFLTYFFFTFQLMDATACMCFVTAEGGQFNYSILCCILMETNGRKTSPPHTHTLFAILPIAIPLPQDGCPARFERRWQRKKPLCIFTSC